MIWSFCRELHLSYLRHLFCNCLPCPLALQVWLKPSAEMQYLYGNHVLKSGLGRITENTPAYTGVVVYSMSDIPLGFGLSAKSTNECRSMEPSGIVVLHQADVGEYLRAEDEL
jgi:60S ribosome subunit biogenesis protein NIP7